MSTLNDADLLLVERNGIQYHVTSADMSNLNDTDLLLVERDGVQYKIEAQYVKSLANNLNPAIPPFVSQSGPETVVGNSDGKVQFSLDGTNWQSSLTIPPETLYYSDWTSDILSAAHGSQYTTSINVGYPNVGAAQDIELGLSIDKLPDPFALDNLTDVVGLLQYTSNTISPLSTINAPTSIWGSSDATDPEIAIADGDWEPLPTTPDTRYVNMNARVRVRHTAGAAEDYPFTTTLNIGYGTAAGEYETSDFVTRTANVVYLTPTITPVDGVLINKDSAVFTMSDPVGANINHVATDWEFASDSGYTNIFASSLNDSSNLLSYTLTGLSEGQTVYARARFIDASTVVSPYATSPALTAREYFFWRFQIRIQGGQGGGDAFGKQAGGSGGSGYVVLESTEASVAPTGSIERYDGTNGYHYDNQGGTADGAFGFDGGSYSHKYGGGGGGAGAFKLNGTLIAGVGGGGGAAAGGSADHERNNNRGGNGAGLPSAAGERGYTVGWKTYFENGGTSSSTGSSGENGGGSSGSASGAGGGGFGGGGGGQVHDDRNSQGGGGGGSWNQSIGYLQDGYQITQAQDTSFTGSTNQVAKYKAPISSPTSWTLVGQNDSSGVIDLNSGV